MMAPHDMRRPEVAADTAAVDAAKVTADAAERGRLLRSLLLVELGRLRSARRLERECSAVFAETSVIVGDALKIALLLWPLPSAKRDEVEGEIAPAKLSAGALELAGLIARSSPAKIGRMIGRSPREVSGWAAGSSSPDEPARAAMASRLRIDAGSWGSP